MSFRKKSYAACQPRGQMEFEISCYVSSPESTRRSSLLEDTYHPKIFKIEVAVCREKDKTQTTSVCRECKTVLLREFSQILPRYFGDDQIDFLLKHELRGRLSSFKVIALLGVSDKEWSLPREDNCPLCTFIFSPFDRANSLSEQSLSRSGDLRSSPYFQPKNSIMKDFPLGDAPFATEVNSFGEMVQKKSRPTSARPNFISGSDLQIKGSSCRDGMGLHRNVSVNFSKLKQCPVCCPHRSKPSDYSRR